MENSVLTAVQAQWLRAHNFFVDELVKFRPDWRSNDRILFEEARKVLTALHQRYVYEDWLPTLIGKEAVEKFLGDSRATTRYNPSVKFNRSFLSFFYVRSNHYLFTRYLVLSSMKLLPVSYVYIHLLEI